MRFSSRVLSLFQWPFRDVLDGLDRCLDEHGPRALPLVALGLVLCWWIYVPIHELLHALGCILAGGHVTTLQIAPMYGGHLFEWLFPFVRAEGPYAGRLSDFDWYGSNLIYLATDFAPYLLTVFPGVWWLRKTGARADSVMFGAATVVALAPFVSIFGDAFEIGGLLVDSLPSALSPSNAAAVRSDDLFLLLSTAPRSDYPTILFAFSLGTVWAFMTYGLGVAMDFVVRRP